MHGCYKISTDGKILTPSLVTMHKPCQPCPLGFLMCHGAAHDTSGSHTPWVPGLMDPFSSFSLTLLLFSGPAAPVGAGPASGTCTMGMYYSTYHHPPLSRQRTRCPNRNGLTHNQAADWRQLTGTEGRVPPPLTTLIA